MEAMVRLADRVVLQVGRSLGEMTDPDTNKPVPAEIIALAPEQVDELKIAFAQPHGNVYLGLDGAITFDPPPPPPPPSPEELAFEADRQILVDFAVDANVDAFLAAANGSATAAQRDAVIKLVIRDLRAHARALRWLVRRDLMP